MATPAPMFQRATKRQAKLRAALLAPSGGGKTYTAMSVAEVLAAGEPFALIDTEHGSASKYADRFTFDVCPLESYDPEHYIAAINAAAAAGYGVLVIDSITHEWKRCLELVDEEVARRKLANSFQAWAAITPRHERFVESILACPAHVICTMRSKTEYVVEQNDRGRSVPRKVGTAPVQRDGLEYEFDFVAELDNEHTLVVSKSRCPELADAVIKQPGKQLAETLAAWLGSGAPALEVVQPRPVAPAALPEQEPQPAQPVQAVEPAGDGPELLDPETDAQLVGRALNAADALDARQDKPEWRAKTLELLARDRAANEGRLRRSFAELLVERAEARVAELPPLQEPLPVAAEPVAAEGPPAPTVDELVSSNTKAQLEELAKQHGVDGAGTKQELAERIVAAAGSSSSAHVGPLAAGNGTCQLEADHTYDDNGVCTKCGAEDIPF